MLKLYRRHLSRCPHKSKGREYKKCTCPIWIDGMCDGKRCRYSLDTFNWEEASQKILEISAHGKTRNISVAAATEDFLADCRTRLKAGTVELYAVTLTLLVKFCIARGINWVRALDTESLKMFASTLSVSDSTKRVKIQILRIFMSYCLDMGWCETNSARRVRKPKDPGSSVLPFTAEQHQAILAACETYPITGRFGQPVRARLRALVLVLRYTGLRMSDVVRLRPGMIKDGRLFLRTIKTGECVHLPLPEVVLEALAVIENGFCYYFTCGREPRLASPEYWGVILKGLFKRAGVKGHPHMYRHTLAVELLENGVLVEHVAAILGNSPEVIHRHYAPWIKSRQTAMEAAVKTVWDSQEAA